MFLSHFPFLFSRCFCIFAFLVARMQTIYAICHCTFFTHHPPTKRKPSTKERERVLWAREREPDSQPKDFSLAEWLKKQKSLNKIKSNNMHGARKARMPCHSSSTASQFATPPRHGKTPTSHRKFLAHTQTHRNTHTQSHMHTLSQTVRLRIEKRGKKSKPPTWRPQFLPFFAGEIFCLFLSSTYLLLCHWLLLPSTASSRKSRKNQAAVAAAAAAASNNKNWLKGGKRLTRHTQKPQAHTHTHIHWRLWFCVVCFFTFYF